MSDIPEYIKQKNRDLRERTEREHRQSVKKYTPPKLTEVITQKEVLSQWPISKATLYRARKEGLPFVVMGAHVCYRPQDLNAYFGERK